MIIEVDFEFMLKHKINIEQYMLCYLLHEDTKGFVDNERQTLRSDPPISVIYKYTQVFDKLDRTGVEDLIQRGYLDHAAKDSFPDIKLSPDLMDVTSKFSEEVFNHWTNFQQLFEEYPSFLVLQPNKPKARLKVLNKPFEEVASYYERLVRTKAKHKKVLNIVRWAKDKNKLNLSLQNFVYSRFWTQLEDEYNKVIDSDDSFENNEVLI